MFGRAVDTSLGNVWPKTYLKTIGKKANEVWTFKKGNLMKNSV